ncbi:DUF3800 domain-containing protein [Rhodovulum sulfidophilum]|uniref:DUF3800 domain-containing protein n=1 Tax=Rhodovulum sulfidophilum TaxID=35806 RepID=A0ABS1RQ85_RHOSU|nr:DUF3800 domain-containing protein [Rhodovulum sulfidophilum]MBL3608235.1 DUF3800 domain-containing protein [Rhodovulum sulfidophilum]MCE8457972.1 DUF3800 domain-containing protein [Rhodovulum sulfidophilum]
MTDIQTLRGPFLALHHLPGVDAFFTFYYDETNNIRRLLLTPDGMNIRRPNSFVLGGILHYGAPRPIDLKPLRDALQLQPTVTELKLKHIGKGGFLDLLSSPRLKTFLRWTSDEDFLIHYQVTDLLYWSIVDIIDSILAEADAPHLLMAHMMLKDSLYALLRNGVDATAELFGRYSYPHVGRARRVAFIAELLNLLEAREDELPHFEFYMLKGVLQIAQRLERLPYLEDEEPNVLIDGFGSFFLNRLCLFNKSQHILDDEKQVETYLSGLDLTDRGAPLRHFRFANSKSEPGIQLSDPVAGLLGKLFSYVKQTSTSQITVDLEQLSDQQRSTLALLARLLDRSTAASPAFAQHIISKADRRHAALLLMGDILAF